MDTLSRLVDALRCLPGVGPKSAQRIAFHLLQQRQRSRGLNLACCLNEAMTQINHCKRCNNYIEHDLCIICSNSGRDTSVLCVVESPADVAAIEQFNKTLDFLDLRLSSQKYLLGDILTEADIRLWVTLVRFDVKENANHSINSGLQNFPHLWAYAKRLYALPEFKRTTDFHSFASTGVDLSRWREDLGEQLISAQAKEN